MEENEQTIISAKKERLNYGKIIIILGIIFVSAGILTFILGNQFIIDGNIRYATAGTEAIIAKNQGAHASVDYYTSVYVNHATWDWNDGLYLLNVSKIVMFCGIMCFAFGSMDLIRNVDSEDKITKIAFTAIILLLIYFLMQFVLYQPELAAINPFVP